MKLPSAGLASVAALHSDDKQRDLTKAALQVHREEAEVKAYKARRRLYATIADKVESELEKRDLSGVKTEKLVEILLRLTEIARQDEPPELRVTVGFQSV